VIEQVPIDEVTALYDVAERDLEDAFNLFVT
jgi:hypothetical protein